MKPQISLWLCFT